MARAKGSAGTPATAALTAAGITFSVHAYEHDPRATSFGLEAAAALGLDPEHVFKTLLVDVDGKPHVAIVPVSTTVDLKAVAQAAGGRKAEMTDPAMAQRTTGYVVGGISPIGQRKALRTFIDNAARELACLYVSGGKRGLDLGLAPEDLRAITGAEWAPIARRG